MKYRVCQTNMRIPAESKCYWVVEYKKHWWSRWKMVEQFASYNHCPLFFRSRKEAEDYIKGV